MTEGIYDPKTNQISGVTVAQELAGLEKNQGRDAALAREKELQRQAETGLTDKERDNIAIMDSVEEKYPDAFAEAISESGKKVLVQEMSIMTGDSRWIRVFSEEGVFNVMVSSNTRPEDIAVDRFLQTVGRGLDKLEPLSNGVRKMDVGDFFKEPGKTKLYGVAVIGKNLGSSYERSEIHKSLQESQIKGEESKRVAPVPVTRDQIIAEL